MSDFTYQEGLPLDWVDMNENLRLIQEKYLAGVNNSAIAIAAANFKGNWTSLTGPLAVPASVYHSSKFWLLLSNLADVTAATPGVSGSWVEVNAGNVQGPASATDNALARFDLTTGRLLQSSVATLSDAGALSGIVSLNGGSAFGLRDKVINGNFDIWQGATTLTNPNGTYLADQWIMSVGSGTGSASRQSFTVGQTDVPGEPTYFGRVSATNTSAQVILAQRIEDVRTLAGKTVTLTFYIKGTAGVSLAAGYPQLRQNFGAGGSSDVTYTNPGAAVTLSATWQKVTRTFTLSSISGKTIGTDHYLTLLPARVDGVVVDVDLARVSLVEGSTDSVKEDRPPALELMLCQRYFYRVGLGAAFNLMGRGQCMSTTAARIVTDFPVRMRKAPTALGQTGTAANYAVSNASGSSVVCSAVPTFVSASEDFAQTTFTVASGLVAGDATLGYAASGVSTAYLEWSARL